jgi:hypothetical protein
MAHPEWHRHPGVLVAARGVAARPVPAFVVGSASSGRRPPVVLAVRRPGTDEWVPFVARPQQVLTTWERWRAVIRGALDVQVRTDATPHPGQAAPRALAAAG